MKSNDWKDRLGIMYSTNPDFQYNTGDEEEASEREAAAAHCFGQAEPGRQGRDIGHRFPGNDRRFGSTWKIFESEMRCRWLG